MAKSYTLIDIDNDTFYAWFTKTNDMLGAFANTVTLSTDSTAQVSTGNGFIVGALGANILTANSSLRGGNASVSAELSVTSNVSFTGGKLTSTANLNFSGANLYFSSNSLVVAANSTVNALTVATNSTATSVALLGNSVSVTGNVTLSNTLSVGSDLSITGNSSISGDLTLNTQSLMSSNTATLAGTSDQLVDSFSGTTYRGGKYVLSVRDTSNSAYQMTEIMLMHDGTNAFTTEYGTLRSTANNLATFSANVSGSTVRLYAKPTVANSAVKLSKTLIVV